MQSKISDVVNLEYFFLTQLVTEISTIIADDLKIIPFGELLKSLLGYDEGPKETKLFPVINKPSEIAFNETGIQTPLFYILTYKFVHESLITLIDFIIDVYSNRKTKRIDDIFLIAYSYKRLISEFSDNDCTKFLFKILEDHGIMQVEESFIDKFSFLLDELYSAQNQNTSDEEINEKIYSLERLIKPSEDDDTLSIQPNSAWLEKNCIRGDINHHFLIWLRNETRSQLLGLMDMGSNLIYNLLRNVATIDIGSSPIIEKKEDFIFAEKVIAQYKEYFIDKYLDITSESKNLDSYCHEVKNLIFTVSEPSRLNDRNIQETIRKKMGNLGEQYKEISKLIEDCYNDEHINYKLVSNISRTINYPLTHRVLKWLSLNAYSIYRRKASICAVQNDLRKIVEEFPDYEKINNLLNGLEKIETLAFASKKRYRDHLSHTCRVALTGLILFCDLDVEENSQDNNGGLHRIMHSEENLRYLNWIYLALLHDSGYIIEHLDYLFIIIKYLSGSLPFDAFENNINYIRGNLLYSLGLELRKDPFLEDRVIPSSLSHPLVSYENSKKLIKSISSMDKDDLSLKSIALHHHPQYVPINPATYSFWLLIIDEFQEWNRAVSTPPEVSEYIRSLLTTGGIGQENSENYFGNIEIRSVEYNKEKQPNNKEEFYFSIIIPGDPSIFSKTLFCPLIFVWNKWCVYSQLGKNEKSNYKYDLDLITNISCYFTNDDEFYNWKNYFTKISSYLERDIVRIQAQIEEVSESFASSRSKLNDNLHMDLMINFSLLVFCCGLMSSFDIVPKDQPLKMDFVRFVISKQNENINRDIEVYKKGKTPWVSLGKIGNIPNSISKIINSKSDIHIKGYKSILIDVKNKKNIERKILELHESALGELIGRNRAKEIIEKYAFPMFENE